MTRKFRLREYHQEVVARLQGLAEASATPISSKLGIELGGAPWLVDLAAVSEVIAVPDFIPVPLTRAWYRGLANIRGNLYGIVDATRFLDGGPTPAGLDNRLLLPHARFRTNCGLLVKRVLGLRNPAELEPLPAPQEPAAWVAGEFTDTAGQRWKELDIAGLMASPEFLNIALYRRRDVFSNILQQQA
ncbi:MAG: chemotaxis protein CheW [Betaproteobacteria bacterium]|nr:chemotaxis protein CheW [Betaproteobacteria bacterium]